MQPKTKKYFHKNILCRKQRLKKSTKMLTSALEHWLRILNVSFHENMKTCVLNAL